MKKCDCEHWETCMICYPQGFDGQGNRKPVEVPPTREELQAKVAALTAEHDRLKTVQMKYRRMEFNAQLQEKLARANAVIEKCRVALSDWQLCNLDEEQCDEALSAIADYQKGVKS